MSPAFGHSRSTDPSRPVHPVPAPFAPGAGVLPADSASQDIFRTSLRRSLQLHRRLVLAFATSGLVLAFAYLIAYWSSYTAQCLVYIQPTPTAVLESVAPVQWQYNDDPATFDSYIQQQLLNITRQDVLVGALHKLGLGVWQKRGESDQSAADRLKGSIDVARLGASYQISITAHASNPETAAAVANAVAASYIEITSHEQKAGDAQQLAMLSNERDRVKKELDEDTAEQAALNANSGTTTGETTKLRRSSDLASDITRLQNLYFAVDEQFQNQSLEDAAPGMARLAAAATVPPHPDESKVISNAAALLLVFVFLGFVAAIAAHKIDPRVCVASDVERLLGVAPMAQLPDFEEVSEEVADVHLLRLAAAFDYAATNSGMRSCIFTGTGPRVGVTTIAARLKDKLETMGRAAVLVDATGTTHEPFGAGDDRSETELASQANSRPITLLQQVAGRGEAGRGELILADTAPLAVSAETECLARFADCAIVVIESDVTTRAQLRRVASLLQRLNLNAVGFVLNRVTLAKADAPFRNSVEELEKHLRTQERSTDWQAIRRRYFWAEFDCSRAEAGVSADSAAANHPISDDNGADRTAEAEEAALAEHAAPLPDARREIQEPSWEPDNMPWWLSEAMARFEDANTRPSPRPVIKQDNETLTNDKADNDESAAAHLLHIVEGETSKGIEAPSNESTDMLLTVVPEDLNQAGHPASHASDAPAAPAEPERGNRSRLSGLRGIAPPRSLKDLEHARRSSDYVSEAAPAADQAGSQPGLENQPNPGSSRLSRLRGFVSAAGLREFGQVKQPAPIKDENTPVGRATPSEAAPLEPPSPKVPIPTQTVVSYPAPDSSLTGSGGSAQPVDLPQALPDEVELLRAHLAARPLDRRETWGAVQILPSRRGQYRKND